MSESKSRTVAALFQVAIVLTWGSSPSTSRSRFSGHGLRQRLSAQSTNHTDPPPTNECFSIGKYRNVPLRDMQLGPILQEMTEIAIRHEVPLPASLTLTSKAMAQMQQTATELDPELDPFEVAGSFLMRTMTTRIRTTLDPKWVFYESQKFRVSGTRTDGEPCGSQIVSESGYCFAHDPTVAEERTRARRRGGHASSAISRTRRLAPAALRDVYSTLEAALGEVHNGELSPRRAMAMASLARAMVTVLTAGELEERVRAIEEGLHDFPS